MKRVMLLGFISILLLTGCGKTFGKGAELICSGNETSSGGISYKATHYVYTVDGKVNKVDIELDLNNKEDFDTVCKMYKEFKDKNNEYAKEWTLTCDNNNVYIENYITKTNNSKIANYTTNDFKKEVEKDGFTCK